MALAQVLISWDGSQESPVNDTLAYYLISVLQPLNLSTITVDDTQAGKLSGIAEKLSPSMNAVKGMLPSGSNAFTLLVANLDRSYMYFCDWKEFASVIQERQGVPTTFMIIRWGGNEQTHDVEQYKDFSSTRQLPPFKQRIIFRKSSNAKAAEVPSSVTNLHPKDQLPQGFSHPLSVEHLGYEETKVVNASEYSQSQSSPERNPNQFVSTTQVSAFPSQASGINSPQHPDLFPKPTKDLSGGTQSQPQSWSPPAPDRYQSQVPLSVPSTAPVQDLSGGTQSQPSFPWNAPAHIPRPQQEEVKSSSFYQFPTTEVISFPNPVNPPPVQREKSEIQVPSAYSISQRRSEKQVLVKRSTDESSAVFRARLQTTYLRFIPSPSLQQGQLGQAMSRKFADLLYSKEQAFSAQVQQLIESLVTDIGSVTQQVWESENQSRGNVQQYHAEAYQMYQDIFAAKQELLNQSQGEIIQWANQMSADLVQSVGELENKVNDIPYPKRFPMKVTLGALQYNGDFRHFLIVRWKTRSPEEAKCVQIVSTAGLANPGQVFLSEDLELIPIENVLVPSDIDLIEGGVSLLKHPFQLTQDDINAIQYAEWEFNREAFYLEQQVAGQYWMNHQSISSPVITHIKELIASNPGQSAEYYFSKLG